MIPKAVTKTVQTLSDAASKSFTVTGYILSVILIDSVTKEQVIGDVSFENATASANGKVTVTLAAAPPTRSSSPSQASHCKEAGL